MAMSFLQRPQFQQPKSRSEMLAVVLKNMQAESQKPNPRTWAETGVRALGQGLQGFVAGKAIKGQEEQSMKQAQMLADALSGGDPEKAAQLKGMLGNLDGVPAPVVSALMERMFPGKKKPIEINGRLVDPDTYEVIKDFSDPKAPNLETIYDEDSGREHKARWNPETGEWERVGGLKSGQSTRSPFNVIIPGVGVRLSDDGQTYLENGKRKPLPPGSYKQGAEGAGQEVRTQEQINRAREELGQMGGGAQAAAEGEAGQSGFPSVEEAARGGTGPWRSLGAAFDAVVGGATEDMIFSAEGIFPETQENRQVLRNFNQLAKPALVNNPRFPVAEVATVDRLLPDPDTVWQNPAEAARKVRTLRRTLTELKKWNLQEIASGPPDSDALSKLVANNQEIDRALALMGPASGAGGAGGLTPEQQRLIDHYGAQ